MTAKKGFEIEKEWITQAGLKAATGMNKPNYESAISVLPEHMRDAARRWLLDAEHPGSFLMAVLRNDLLAACLYADAINSASLSYYGLFLSRIPRASWGEQNVQTWEGLRGMDIS